MFKGFFYNKKINLNTPFVQDLKVCTSLYCDFSLVKLSFSNSNYSDQLFETFNISLPQVILKSTEKRQSEFLAGRLSAKYALKELASNGEAVFNVGIGGHRQPIWPIGYIGSISHTNDKALAIVSNRNEDSIGIDIENIHPINVFNDVSNHIFRSSEYELLRKHGFSSEQIFSIIFSAKESVFKSLFGLVNIFFDFDVARLDCVDIENFKLVFNLNNNFSERFRLPVKQTVLFEVTSKYVITYTVNANKSV
jgi:4'-phosphopantetheinyl transferase EntD